MATSKSLLRHVVASGAALLALVVAVTRAHGAAPETAVAKASTDCGVRAQQIRAGKSHACALPDIAWDGSVAANTWHTIEVQAKDDVLRTFWNGKKVSTQGTRPSARAGRWAPGPRPIR